MASIYCGTYASYNNGDLFGKWFDLSDYPDKESFIAACRAFHAREQDPELMFQDWEDIPSGWVSESNVDPQVWEWLKLSERDRNVVKLYLSHVDLFGTIACALEAFRGTADSPEAFVEDFLEETGQLNTLPDWVRPYVDFEAMATDWRCSGTVFVHEDGQVWVFSD